MTDANTLADVFLAMGDRLAQSEYRNKSLEQTIERLEEELQARTKKIGEDYDARIKLVERNQQLERELQNIRENSIEGARLKDQTVRQLKEMERLEKMIADRDLLITELQTQRDNLAASNNKIKIRLDSLISKKRKH